MKRILLITLFAVAIGSLAALAQGGFANRTQCYINGQFVTVVGNCPATSSSGSGSSGVNSNMSSGFYNLGYAFGRWLFSSGSNSNPQADLQKQQMMEELRRREQEAARQHREEEARRLAAMYNRLAATLKLSGLPYLQLKEIASKGPGLTLKLGDASQGYGIPGLPGIYTGGPGPGSGMTPRNESKLQLKTGDSADANHVGNPNLPGLALNDGEQAYGIPGLPGIYTGGPGSGSGMAPKGEPGLKMKTGDSSAAPAAQAGIFDPSKMTPQQLADVAEMVSKLPPDEQQRLMTAARNGAGRPQQAVMSPAGSPAPPNAASPPGSSPVLSPQTAAQPVASLQQQANASQAAAAATVPEDVSMKARAGFDTPLAGSATRQAPVASSPQGTARGDQQLPGSTVASGSVPGASGGPSAMPTMVNSPSLSAGTEGSPQPPARGKIDVPVPRPEGWIATANKGNRTLAFVATRTEAKVGCNSAEQVGKLEQLRVLGQQLARTEKLINDIDRQTPERFDEFKRLDEQLRNDKKQFIDKSISSLASSTFAMHNELHRGTLQSTAEGVEILKKWKATTSDWNDRLENLKRLRSVHGSENIQGLLELSSDMAEQMKDIEGLPGAEYLRDIFKSVGMAKKVKDVTDVALGFGKLEMLSDYRVNAAAERAEADLKARAVLLPLQRRLSDKIDSAQRDPVLARTSCP